MRQFAPHAVDFYKTGHNRMLPEGTEYIYSNLTPRSARLARQLPDADDRMVFFGLQRFIKDFLIDQWNETFFNRPKEVVLAHYKRRVDGAIGKGAADIDSFAALHDLGYLPLHIRALPEGSRVPMKVPALTIINTDERFPWLTNYLESVLSSDLWKSCVNSSQAYEFRRLLETAAMETVGNTHFVPFQGHDFSMRGMSGHVDAANSGVAHLTSFVGTDTVGAIDVAEEFYPRKEGEPAYLIGASVPATEHMVMCMGGQETEIETYRRLITQVHPSGVVSIVSDTWDYFKVLDNYNRVLKDEILGRRPDENGMAKVVFRPDSGDPVHIICGDPNAPVGSPEHKGSVEVLWDIFGGSVTEKGYRVLNERVGLIYGDAITLERAKAIIEGLKAKGFASTNIVFGIGSFSYQFVTRDSFSIAMKATWGQVNGQGVNLLKDPKTSDGSKRSATGLLRVEEEGGTFVLYENQTKTAAEGGALRTVFLDGDQWNVESLGTVRGRIDASLKRA